MTRRPLLLGLILFLFLGTHCASVTQHDTSTPEGAYNMALEYAKAHRYEEAISLLRQIKTKYPYSSYAARSELKIADLHFENNAFVEAEASYQLFRELYPRHPQMDYVTYQIGMSFFKQLPDTTDRDLSAAHEALSFFEALITSYPGSEYVQDARQKRQEILEKLAAKEIYIADFYRKRQDYGSALGRYEGVVQKYSETSYLPQALYGAAVTAARADEPIKSRNYAQTLRERFPNSPQVEMLKGELSL